jgi:hypothetical protein
LLTFQRPISWLKASAPINIPDISVTLPTSQSPISWLKVVARITVLANTFVDIVGNTNTAIAKNTTKISDLKDQVDIDGSGFDVVLFLGLNKTVK